ncbi:LysR family transcriptional regulator [Pararobbsia alpina]|uniref:LysR family transcriptional regulator n=1 Tax=Pararobbsia alpina TaxID=621374 RepID=UPI0039A53A73
MKTPDIEIDLLRAFVAVAEAGSFTAAADVVGRTQSAVSQKILRLEDILQMRVFERTSRSLTLTRDGERVLSAARRLLEHYEGFAREVLEPPPVSVLRLGVSENLIQIQLPNLLSRMKTLFPGVQIELTTGTSKNLADSYARDQFDVVVVGTFEKTPTSRGQVIWSEPLMWVAGANYRDNPASQAELIMMQPPCIYREIMAAALDSTAREWTNTCTVSNLTGLNAAIGGGLGVSVLSKSQVREGMKTLRASKQWPALPPIQVEVIGGGKEIQHLLQPLVSLLRETLQGGGGGATPGSS